MFDVGICYIISHIYWCNSNKFISIYLSLLLCDGGLKKDKIKMDVDFSLPKVNRLVYWNKLNLFENRVMRYPKLESKFKNDHSKKKSL